MAKRKQAKIKKAEPNRPAFFNILILLFLFFLPSQLGKHFFFDFSYISAVRIDYLAPTLFLTDLFALTVMFFNLKKIIPVFKNKFFLILAVFLVLNIVFSLSPLLSVYKSIKILEIIFLFVTLKNPSINPQLMLSAFLSGGVIQLILAGLQLFYKHSIQGAFYLLGERLFTLSTPGIAKASYQGIELLRPYGTFSHPNSMAGFYLLLHAFVLTYKPFDKYPLLKYPLLLLSAALVLISFSKIAILGFFLVTLLYTVTHIREINCKFCIFSRITVAAILVFIFSLVRGDPLSGQQRIILAQNAWEIIKTHLATGIGLGSYLLAESKFSMKTSYFFLQPVHNIFLLFMAETGVFLSGYLAYLLWRIRKIFVDNQCLAYSVAVIIFTGMLDHYWLTLQQNMLLATVLLTTAWGNHKIHS